VREARISHLMNVESFKAKVFLSEMTFTALSSLSAGQAASRHP
jgi:hypothetical protein